MRIVSEKPMNASKPPLIDQDIAQVERLPPELYAGPVAMKRGRGPNKAPTKKLVSIRLSPEVIQYFRATGRGWQTRINAVLEGWVSEQIAS